MRSSPLRPSALRVLALGLALALSLSACVEEDNIVSDAPAETCDGADCAETRGAALNVNHAVPYINQRGYTDIGESACGPTSMAMLLRFYYPNSRIEPDAIYHAGTQLYGYHGPARGYQSVSFAPGDDGLYAVPSAYRDYYSGNYSGARNPSVWTDAYLNNVWGLSTQRMFEADEVYNAIANGPVLVRVYAHGRDERYGDNAWGHYVVMRGVDDRGTSSRSDDIIYINDPYGVWNSAWDTDGNNKAVSYSDFFVSGAPFGGRWFREAIRVTPAETPAQRAHTVVVDTGHSTISGDDSAHRFFLDDPNSDDWRFYYGSLGDWYYPQAPGHTVRWTPRLSATGRYQVSVKFYGDGESGNVRYRIYDANDQLLRSVTVNQHRSSPARTWAVLANDITLSNGAYVRAENIPAGSNLDAVKFKYLGAASSGSGGSSGAFPGWSYCTSSQPCSHGYGDCDSDAECAPGHRCVHDIGPNYGWSSSVDVCERDTTSNPGPTPAPFPGWSYCSSSQPCSHGFGDCDSDAECAPGHRCVRDVGPNYGWPSSADVCERDTTSGGGGSFGGGGASGSTDDHGDTRATASVFYLNGTYPGRINHGGDHDYFRFRAGSSRAHTFETSGSTDTYCSLYNQAGTLLTENDDGGSGTNCRISRTLTSGNIYYLRIRHYSASGTGDYSVSVRD